MVITRNNSDKNRYNSMKKNLICYCFKYTEADLEADILKKGIKPKLHLN